MKTLLISTAIIAVMSVWSGAETIPFCKDVPAYTDCQSPNGSGGWTMVMYHLTEKERVYLRKADKLTELQRQNTEAIKKAVGAEPEIKISTESGHIYAEANGKKIEVPKIAFCQAWGHIWECVVREWPQPTVRKCSICGKRFNLRQKWEVIER